MKANKALDKTIEKHPPVLRANKNAFSVHKSRWKRNVRDLDQRIVKMVRAEYKGKDEWGKEADPLPLMDYKVIARKVCILGTRGEELLERAVDVAAPSDVIGDIRDVLNTIEAWSVKILKIVTAKWAGEEPSDWPLYQCDVAPTCELIEQAESIRQLNKMVED